MDLSILAPMVYFAILVRSKMTYVVHVSINQHSEMWLGGTARDC